MYFLSVSTHISGLDLLERALINTAEMIEDDKLQAFKDEGYNGRRNCIGKQIMNGNATLDDMANDCLEENTSPKPVSGRQEYLENIATYAVK